MKRHLVMDLHHGNQIKEVGDWKSVDTLPNIKSCKVKVKMNDDSETFAYFYLDAAVWVQKYGIKSCHFWDCKTKEQIFDVKEWKMVE